MWIQHGELYYTMSVVEIESEELNLVLILVFILKKKKTNYKIFKNHKILYLSKKSD